MNLGLLLRGLNTSKIKLVKGPGDVDVNGLATDSRRFKAGDLFIAVRGARFDGHDFVQKACADGAAAVAVERQDAVPSDYEGPVIVVENARSAVDGLASRFYGDPSKDLFVAGVTGTNGKTTTTHMIEAVLNAGGKPAAVMGTIDYHFGKSIRPSTHTTPDAIDLQGILSEWRKNGAKAVAMEVSSHALAQKRADSVAFDAAVFTNLTRDHLDFHKTMDEYVAAKARLFGELLENSPKRAKRAILNADDPSWGKMKPTTVPFWTYGFGAADFSVSDCRLSLDGTTFVAATPAGPVKMSLKMIGRHNVYNALASMAVALQAGGDPGKVAEALGLLEGVRGRLERVPSRSAVRVFVDYAHSDDALTNVLDFLKSLRDQTSPGARLITVFGCGGDRDKGKRPLMFEAARSKSDRVIVTSDNPRTEDPERIIDDVLSGAKRESLPKNVAVHVDRRRAIEVALKEARPMDVVLIAGKGHEDYQIIGTTKHPFDDVKVAKEILGK